MRRATIAGLVLASALVGGAMGVTVLSPSGAGASSASATARNMSAFVQSWTQDRFGGGRHEAVSDLSVAAKALGISESDLTAALAKGQTIAQVAKSHNVDPQKVIDALVADARSELAAAVKSGRLTRAEATQMQAGIVARVTAQVNRQFHLNGPFGGGHHHDHDSASTPSTYS